MKQSILLSVFGAVLLVAGFCASAQAEKIEADLIGFREVPSVSTVASGEFHATINPGDQSIDYELRYSGLQGTVQQGHIHVAQLSVNGSIVIWLCQTATPFLDPAKLAPQCPPGKATEAVVTGHITAANVIAGATTSQQLAAGNLAAVIEAIRAGFAYANVHTNLSPGGEIRGQIKDKDRDDKRDDDHDKHHD
jgi:CHRD domain